jgi:hypothetical protein
MSASLSRYFQDTATTAFSFLPARYGFGSPEVERPDGRSVVVTYRSAWTGVRLSLDLKDQDLFVYLIRLIDGAVPSYAHRPEHWAYLDTLITSRGGASLPHPLGDGLTRSSLGTLLARYADGLAQYGEAILRGDFAEFDAVSIAGFWSQTELGDHTAT